MQVPAVTTQEGERFLETIVEEAPEQAGIPAAQGENAGISVQDRDKDLKDELESAVSAFLWPDAHAEMTPPSFWLAAERQMPIPGGINNTRPLV